MRYLIRDLKNHPSLKIISGLTTGEYELATIMPASIARWIEVFQPALKEKDAIHIAVVGAEAGPDRVDEGRWYQLIPILLGKPDLRVSVTLVGPNVDTSTRGGAEQMKVLSLSALKSNARINITNWEKASIYKGMLGDYIRQLERPVDLFILSHPGFEEHTQGWFEKRDLSMAIELGVPIGVMSDEKIEYEHERWLLDSFGYEGTEKNDRNPFSKRDDSVLASSTAHTLWEITNKQPVVGYMPDESRINQMKKLAFWQKALFRMNGLQVFDQPIPILVNGNPMAELLPNYFIDISTLNVFFRMGDEMQWMGFDLKSQISAFQSNPRFHFEKTLWVAEAAILMGQGMDSSAKESKP